jgi:hypothetical protein
VIRDLTTRSVEGLDAPGRWVKDGRMSETSTDLTNVDPVIADAVENISNRFGTQGLCDLIALAREELARAESALRELSDLE